jgi:hypothetical protein
VPFYAQTGFGFSIINIAIGIDFYNEMTQALNNFEQHGNKYAKENFFTGCFIGLLATVLWFVIAAVLIIAVNLFRALLFSRVNR